MQLNTVMAAQLVQAFVFGEDLQGFKKFGVVWTVHLNI
jgi:hypothetical protein